jgi:hypothetical protein
LQVLLVEPLVCSTADQQSHTAAASEHTGWPPTMGAGDRRGEEGS